MPQKASSLKNLIDWKSYWRFVKKGLSFVVIFGLLKWMLDALLKNFVGVDLNIKAMGQFSSLSAVMLVSLSLALLVSYALVGFLTEYLDYGNSGFHKFINK